MGRKRPDIGIPKIGLPVHGGKDTGQFGFMYVGDQLVFDPDLYHRFKLRNKSVCRTRKVDLLKSEINNNREHTPDLTS